MPKHQIINNNDPDFEKSETWPERFKRYEYEFALRKSPYRYKFTTSIVANDFDEVITLLNKYSPDRIYKLRYFDSYLNTGFKTYTDEKLDGGIQASHTSGTSGSKMIGDKPTVDIALYLDNSGLREGGSSHSFRFLDFVDEPHVWHCDAMGRSKIVALGDQKLFSGGACVGTQKYIRRGVVNVAFIRDASMGGAKILDPISRDPKTGLELYRIHGKQENFCIKIKKKDTIEFSHTFNNLTQSTMQTKSFGKYAGPSFIGDPSDVLFPANYVEFDNGASKRLTYQVYWHWTAFYGVMMKGKDNEFWDMVAQNLANKMVGGYPGSTSGTGMSLAYRDSMYPVALAATLKMQDLFLGKIAKQATIVAP